MDIQEFVAHFAEQFEDTDASVFVPETNFCVNFLTFFYTFDFLN